MMNPTPPCAVCGSPVEMEIDSFRMPAGVASTALMFEHPKQVVRP